MKNSAKQGCENMEIKMNYETDPFLKLSTICSLTAVIAFFSACQLMQSRNVNPLQKEAIERGYAYYGTTNTTSQSTTQFTWK